MEALKACPFCGTNDRTAFAVEWRECACGATGPDGAEAWNRRPIEDALRAECDAAVARAELAEARLAKIVGYIKTFSIEAHERYMACDVMQPAHLTKYGAATALDSAASDIGMIATDPKPNRMILDRAAAVR